MTNQTAYQLPEHYTAGDAAAVIIDTGANRIVDYDGRTLAEITIIDRPDGERIARLRFQRRTRTA